MKMKFTDLPVGSCFLQGRDGLHGREGNLKKKVAERKTAVVKDNGKVSTRKVKGDPEVEPAACPLRYLGVGLRRHPDQVVEVGDGNILERRKRK